MSRLKKARKKQFDLNQKENPNIEFKEINDIECVSHNFNLVNQGFADNAKKLSNYPKENLHLGTLLVFQVIESVSNLLCTSNVFNDEFSTKFPKDEKLQETINGREFASYGTQSRFFTLHPEITKRIADSILKQGNLKLD